MICIIDWNNMNLSEYIRPFRLKNMMMSLSGIVLGTLLAAADYHVNFLVALALAAAVLSLQVFTTMIPGILFAFVTVWLSYGSILSMESLIVLFMGYFAYRLVKGHSPESGLFRNGIVVTLSTWVIYGFLPIYGTYFITSHSFGNVMLLLPVLSIGSLCLAAVNSDYLSDSGTRFFHTLWVCVGIAAMVLYSCMRIFDPSHFLYLVMIPVFAWLLVKVWRKGDTPEGYDVIFSSSLLAFAILSGAGFLVYLI